MQTSALFEAKNSDFLKFMLCTEKESWASANKGEGWTFRDFMRTSFMDGPL